MIELLRSLEQVENLARGNRLKRFLYHPYKYFEALTYRYFIYPILKTPLKRKANTFFGKQISIALPAATDIYLTGGKTHLSEIKLAKFIIKNFKEDGVYIDVGAHYGYFSLLAAKTMGIDGKVFSFEASPDTFNLLQTNTSDETRIRAFNNVVSNTLTPIIFYQFPALYSEYNSTDITCYEKEDWFRNYPPQKLIIEATTIDKFVKNNSIKPSFIKIDVEGSEYDVIRGATETLGLFPLVVAMEYLADKHKNSAHRSATQFLLEAGYKAHVINNAGEMVPVKNIEQYLGEEDTDSDNIIFSK